MQINQILLEQAADLIRHADGMLIGAGAGMGVDSGLPDFRGPEGFWQAYPALREAGLKFSQIASPAAFEANPQRAWGFYGHRLALYRRTAPHAGFALLRQWAADMPLGARVFTSNVDGQFQQAGFEPRQVLECHGSIHRLQCSVPCRRQTWSADGLVPELDEARCLLRNALPQCPHCGALARPNVMMFYDWAWVDRGSTAAPHQLNLWLDRVERLVVIEVGAGTAIPSVRLMSHRAIIDHGARLVRINLREAQTPAGHVGLALGALQALSAMDALL